MNKEKLVVIALTVFCLVSVSFSAQAEEIAEKTSTVVNMINDNGEVRLVERSENWRSPSKEESIAIANPGQEIPIGVPEEKVKKVDFFHYMKIQESSEAVVFDEGKGNIQNLKKNIIVEETPFFAWYKILQLIAIGLMSCSYLVKRKISTLAIFAVLSALVSFGAFASVFTLSLAFAVITLVAFAFSVLAASSAMEFRIASFYLFSILFYILAGCSLIL